MWNFDLIHNFDFLFWNGLKKILLLYGELFSLLNSKPRLLHNRTFTTLHYYYQLDYYIFRELLYLHFFLLTDNHSIQPVIIWLFAIFHCNKTSRPAPVWRGEVSWTPGHPIVSNPREHNKPLSPYCTETKEWFKYSSRIGQPPVTWWLRQRQPGNLVARSILARPGRGGEAGRLAGQTKPAIPTATTIQDPTPTSHHHHQPLTQILLNNNQLSFK